MPRTAPPAFGGRRIQTRRSGVHGKGVFAVQDIAEGEVLIEYTGEVISWQEAQDRHPHDPLQPNHTFYFHVDEDRVIDANVGGNSSRWINHSCDPNCYADERDGRIFIKALRNIAAGEELNYDYGLIIDERYTPKLKAEYPCWCGSTNCRGTLLAPKRGAAAPAPLGKAKKAAARRMSTPVRWPAEAIWEAVAPLLPGFTVEVLPSIDSTNSELMRRARAGRCEPVLLVAEQQTAGRGRLGRAWHSGAGRRADVFAGPAAGAGRLVGPVAGRGRERGREPAARAAARGQRRGAHRAEVAQRPVAGRRRRRPQARRHPGRNRQRRGAAGCARWQRPSTAAMRYVVVGVGLNLLPREGAGMSLPPGCLQEVDAQADAPAALLRVVAPLVAMLQSFEAYGFAPMQARFAQRDALLGRAVVLSDGSRGIAHGVGDDGALLVHGERGMQAVTSGDISVRPASAAHTLPG